jgi:hypothetical protein
MAFRILSAFASSLSCSNKNHEFIVTKIRKKKKKKIYCIFTFGGATGGGASSSTGGLGGGFNNASYFKRFSSSYLNRSSLR